MKYTNNNLKGQIGSLVDKFISDQRDRNNYDPKINKMIVDIVLSAREKADQKETNRSYLSNDQKVESLLKGKANLFETLYLLNTNLKPQENKPNLEANQLSDYETLITEICDMVYNEEISSYVKESKDDPEFKNNFKYNIDRYNRNINQAKRGFLVSQGYNNTEKFLKETKENLKSNETLESKLIANSKRHLDKDSRISRLEDSNTFNEREDCRDYRALEEHLKKKNPIARFFSFSAKKALKNLGNHIKSDIGLKSDKDLTNYINSNLSVKNEAYMQEGFAKKNALYDYSVEVNKILDTFNELDKKSDLISEKITVKSDLDRLKETSNDLKLQVKLHSTDKNKVIEGIKEGLEAEKEYYGSQPIDASSTNKEVYIPDSLFGKEYVDNNNNISLDDNSELNKGTIETLNK